MGLLNNPSKIRSSLILLILILLIPSMLDWLLLAPDTLAEPCVVKTRALEAARAWYDAVTKGSFELGAETFVVELPLSSSSTASRSEHRISSSESILLFSLKESYNVVSYSVCCRRTTHEYYCDTGEEPGVGDLKNIVNGIWLYVGAVQHGFNGIFFNDPALVQCFFYASLDRTVSTKPGFQLFFKLH